MAVIGFSDLKEMTLPSLWEEDYLTRIALQDGATLAQMTAEADAALRLVTAEMMSMPHYSGLYSADDEAALEYAVGGSNSWSEASEYTAPDPRREVTTGHMLPIKPYDYGLGWTQMYLRKARASKLRATIAGMVANARNRYQVDLLTRLTSKTANTISSTANADVPFADGGTADSTYVPLPSPQGETFLYTHNHFLGYGTSGITQSTLDQSAVNVAMETLQEHGSEGPWDLVGARADASEWANTENVTGWKPPLFQGVAYQQSAVERAMVSDIQQYVGFIECDYGIVRVWLTPRIPSDNFVIYKTYGPGDMRNPLRMRFDPSFGFGFRMVPGQYVNDPVSLLAGFAEYGVGVGEDRVAAVAVDVGASTYANPTIS